MKVNARNGVIRKRVAVLCEPYSLDTLVGKKQNKNENTKSMLKAVPRLTKCVLRKPEGGNLGGESGIERCWPVGFARAVTPRNSMNLARSLMV